jgi:hypothetical protein
VFSPVQKLDIVKRFKRKNGQDSQNQKDDYYQGSYNEIMYSSFIFDTTEEILEATSRNTPRNGCADNLSSSKDQNSLSLEDSDAIDTGNYMSAGEVKL